MSLEKRDTVKIRLFYKGGAFDHGDVDPGTGDVFIAHTSKNMIEIVGIGDGKTSKFYHQSTIADVAEPAGVLAVPGEKLIIVSARGSGQVMLLDAEFGWWMHKIEVGGKPNGLAWAHDRRKLLVGNVADNTVHLLEIPSRLEGREIAKAELPGPPRWAVYDKKGKRFLINVKEPSLVAIVDPETCKVTGTVPLPAAGAHGMDIDSNGPRAFVACDEGAVVTLDLNPATPKIVGTVKISGQPDAAWWNPRVQRLYVAIANPGVVDVVNGNNNKVVQQLTTEPGTKTTAFDAKRQLFYTFMPQSGAVGVYEEV